MSDVQEYAEQIQERMGKYVDSLTQDELMRRFQLVNDVEESVQITTEDVLIHVVEEN